MRFFLCLFLFAGAGLGALEEPKDELAKLDQLIKVTEEHLLKEKALRELLVQYKEAELVAVKNPDNPDNLLKLVTLAKQLNDGIKEIALDDYFSPKFLEELRKLAQVAERKKIPSPK